MKNSDGKWKSLLFVNLISVLLLVLAVVMYFLSPVPAAFYAVSAVAFVYMTIANYSILVKKEDMEKSLIRYSSRGFRQEITDILSARQSLAARENFFLTCGNQRLADSYRQTVEAVEENMSEALLFLKAYDFVSKPPAARMLDLSRESREAVSDLNELTETLLVEQHEDEGDKEEVLGGYIRRFRKASEKISATSEVGKYLAGILPLLSQIKKQIHKNKNGDTYYRKLFSYYLPTMEKLLGEYVQMQQQSYQGQNMASARADITDSMKDLEMALRNMLDHEYEFAAMDISAEASVLDSMMEQDGLRSKEAK